MKRRHAVLMTVVALGIACGAPEEPPAGSDPAAGDLSRLTGGASMLTADECSSSAVNGKVPVCHATGDRKRPFKLIRVSRHDCRDHAREHRRDYVATPADPDCRGGGCLPAGAPADSTRPCCAQLVVRDGVCSAPVSTDLCAGVVCTASDACHVAGTCDPATGLCSNPAAPDGTACNDGNACTRTDACQAGTCVGSNQVTCLAQDPCHVAGVCDPASGQCPNPNAPDGTACDDANSCTGTTGQPDACVAGACQGGAFACTPTSATITAAGGSVAAGGLSLEFPPGAVRSPVVVTVTPIPTEPGELVAYLLDPPGMTLEQRATMRHAGPFPPGAGFFWSDGLETFLAPTIREGAGLAASIGSLGYDATVATTAAAPAAALMSTAAFQRALVSPNNGAGGGTGVAIIDCEAELALAQSRLAAMNWQTDFARGLALKGQVEALRNQCQQLQIQAIQARACEAWDAAALVAQTIAADTYDAFSSLVKPLLNTAAMVATTGASCDTSSLAALLDAKFAQFIVFLQADFSHPAFADLLNQRRLRDLFRYERLCDLLGLNVCGRFRTDLYPQALDLARQGAYADCLSTGSALELAHLYEFGLSIGGVGSDPVMTFASYTYRDLEEDIHYCPASLLDVRVFDAPPPVEVPSARRQIPGAGPLGSPVTATTVTLPPGGSFTIGGEVVVPICPNGSPSSGDFLVARIGTVEIDRRPVAGGVWTISTSPFDIVPSRDLPRVGLSATIADFDVILERQGPGCGLYLGTFELYRIHVIQPPPPGSVLARQSVINARIEGAPVSAGSDASPPGNFGLYTGSITLPATPVACGHAANVSQTTDLGTTSLGLQLAAGSMVVDTRGGTFTSAASPCVGSIQTADNAFILDFETGQTMVMTLSAAVTATKSPSITLTTAGTNGFEVLLSPIGGFANVLHFAPGLGQFVQATETQYYGGSVTVVPGQYRLEIRSRTRTTSATLFNVPNFTSDRIDITFTLDVTPPPP